MIQVMLFIDADDPRMDAIQESLAALSTSHPHDLHVIDIRQDPILQEEFAEKAPVLDIGVFRLQRTFNHSEIRFAFEKAENRLHDAEMKKNSVMVQRLTQPPAMTKADRFSRWFSNHYMILLNLFTFFYVFFAFLAPVFMELKLESPARVIYKVYSPLCHQLAYRSFFLFGEQPYYPRELAGMEGIITYEEATGFDEFDLGAARNFVGNEVLGYKLALCERDIAIYGAILLFGLVFAASGKSIKPLPWFLWILVGLGPIGLDGFSQLLSQTGLGIFIWLPLRESTPLIRSITGGIFGLATAWFGFPYLEESVQENRREMELKYAIVKQISRQT